jgi:exopolysaccharide biosynthesis predicted pyruvyltransferase EpsI
MSTADRTGNASLIAGLRATHAAVLDELVAPGSRVALIDYPNHSNVGDSAIWLGELEYLRRRGCRISYVCDAVSYHPRRLHEAVGPDGLVLFHGGGNIGDLWPVHTNLLCRVAEELRGPRLIVMPQTLTFGSDGTASRVSAALDGALGSVVVTRDRGSEAYAREQLGVGVRCAPDSAVWLDLSGRQRPAPDVDCLWMGRTDKESGLGRIELPDGVRRADWIDTHDHRRSLGGAGFRLLERTTALMARTGRRSAPLLGLQRSLFDPVARWNLERGVELIRSARVVVTDRLHVHLICVLLDHPHVVLPDANGKVERFLDAWTGGAVGMEWCATAEEALAAAATLGQA